MNEREADAVQPFSLCRKRWHDSAEVAELSVLIQVEKRSSRWG